MVADIPIRPECRTPTRPTAPLYGGSIEVDLEDREAVAQFMEMVARVVRRRGKLKVTIE